MSFGKQALAAGLLMTGLVGGLIYLRRSSSAEQSAVDSTSPAAGSRAAQALANRGRPAVPGAAIRHEARALVPQEAWLLADFRGDFTGARPFEDQKGACQEVPAPARVSLAILPPLEGKTAGPELLLAAPNVSDIFWGCVRDRIVVAGGVVLAENAQFEVLKTPSGVVARGPNHAMLFLSDAAYLERALAVVTDLEASAAATGVHSGLFRRLHSDVSKEVDSAMDLTIYLPPDWLASVGDEAKLSPLRHLQSASLSVGRDGNAQGGVDCTEPGCQSVYEFFVGAKRDLVARLPAASRAVAERAFKMDYKPGTGMIALHWSNESGKFQNIFGSFLGTSHLFGP